MLFGHFIPPRPERRRRLRLYVQRKYRGKVVAQGRVDFGHVTRRPKSSAMDVTLRLDNPHGMMPLKYDRSVLTLRAKPWLVTQRVNLTPMAAILALLTHTPVMPGARPASMPKSANARIMTLFQIAQVLVCVQPVLP